MPPPPPDLRVRLADAKDIAAIAALRARWTGAQAGKAFQQRVVAWLEAEGGRRLVWIATLGADPAGMATLLEYHRMPHPDRPDSRWGYVGNMFVLENLRNRGIGSALLAAIITESEARDYARLVLSPTERAVPFYRRAGFVVPDDTAGDDRVLVRPMTAARRRVRPHQAALNEDRTLHPVRSGPELVLYEIQFRPTTREAPLAKAGADPRTGRPRPDHNNPKPNNERGAPRQRRPSLTTLTGSAARAQLVCAAGGTNPASRDGGGPVWIR